MTIMEKHASTVAYTTGISTGLFGGIALNDIALIVGIICTVVTTAVNWYYQRKGATRYGGQG